MGKKAVHLKSILGQNIKTADSIKIYTAPNLSSSTWTEITQFFNNSGSISLKNNLAEIGYSNMYNVYFLCSDADLAYKVKIQCPKCGGDTEVSGSIN